LNSQLSEIENEIANSRKYYNGIVKKLNNKVEMFPSNIIAEIFKFHSLIMFKTDINEKDNVNVDL
jgi:LemA protein